MLIKTSKIGFTLIEVVVVLLLISIVCQAGVVSYRNLIYDSTYETVSNELNAFFNTCKQISKLRHSELSIELQNNKFVVHEDINVYLKLNNVLCNAFPSKVKFNKFGKLFVNDNNIDKFILPMQFGQGKIASISINI